MKKILLLSVVLSTLFLASCSKYFPSGDDGSGASGANESKENKTEETEKEDEKNSNDREVAKNKVGDEENHEQANPQPQQRALEKDRPLTKEEVSDIARNGGNVDGVVDEDGDTWYQAPGTGHDVMGYEKPDGSVCSLGGCKTPEELEKIKEQNKQQVAPSDEVEGGKDKNEEDDKQDEEETSNDENEDYEQQQQQVETEQETQEVPQESKKPQESEKPQEEKRTIEEPEIKEERSE